jgi:lipopolysaccharide assembly protein A
MNYKLIFSLFIAGMAVSFIIQNVTVVDLKFLFWTLSMSRALLMSLILSTGIIIGWLLHSYFKRSKTVGMQNKSL